MADYTKSTNFATKDNLTSGNPAKIVKGTEIDTEFNNIATAIATKQDYDSDLAAFAAKTAPSGDVVGTTDTQGLTNKTLTNPTVTNYVESVVAIGTVTSAHTLVLTSGTVQTATLTGNCTFTMPTATAGKSFILLLKQPAAGTATTATFTSVKWGNTGAPILTPTVGKMDILSFISDGTSWYGSFVQGYTP